MLRINKIFRAIGRMRTSRTCINVSLGGERKGKVVRWGVEKGVCGKVIK